MTLLLMSSPHTFSSYVQPMITVNAGPFSTILESFPKHANNVSLKSKILKPITRQKTRYSFPALHYLYCDGNELTDTDLSLILSSFDAPLTTLKLSSNKLISLVPFPRFKQLIGFSNNSFIRLFILC